MTRGAQGLDRGDRRAARRDHILDHHAAILGAEDRTLDAPLQPVLLGLRAHEERLRPGPAGERRAGHGIGADRHPAHRGGVEPAGLLGHQQPSAAKPSGSRMARFAST